MTGQDAFKDEFTHSHGGQCYFVAVDPSFPLQVTDIARVVAQVAVQGDDAERSTYVDSLAQRANDALPPPTEPAHSDDADDDDSDETARASLAPPKDTADSLAAKRELVRDVVSQLAQAGRGAIQNLADRQLIGFTNLTLSLVLGLFADDADTSARDELVRSLVDAIAPAVESGPANPALSTRYSALATIFNALPLKAGPLRFHVLTTLVESAAQHDDIAIVRPALAENQLELYFKQAGDDVEVAADETTSRIVEALLKNAAGPKAADPVGTARLAREILLARLSAPSGAGAESSTRTKLGATLLALSFASNDVFDFTPFSRAANRFPAVHQSSSNDALGRTLELFTTETGAELDVAKLPSQADLDAAIAGSTLLPASSTSSSSSAAASSSSASPLSSSAAASPTRLDRAQLERKIKLVKLAQLCEDKVGGQVRYEEIQKQLGLKKASDDDDDDEGEEVETWVIDAIRASLLQGRLSQPTRSLFVTRAAPVAPGAFSTDKWTTVQQRLEGWKHALEKVTQTVEKSLNVTGPTAGGRRAGAEEVMANHHQHQQQQAIEV
ncbi:hypothetical protein BMF94_4017 [Rhodotorula taiwanensis]|uniref:PCI domain-containing protein n=1 Tax=Rhodotorula taiwanensis TaxID=741276 RepID=A0A2S5B894_9BASI|nr:hypothetical protein BMF94_4017 [Rhodotorula taiwanensis]